MITQQKTVLFVFPSFSKAMAYQPIQEKEYQKTYPGTVSRLGFMGDQTTVTFYIQ